jgi:hypothetical protein
VVGSENGASVLSALLPSSAFLELPNAEPSVIIGLTHFSSLALSQTVVFPDSRLFAPDRRPGISGIEAKVTAQIAIREAPPILPHIFRESAFSGELESALRRTRASFAYRPGEPLMWRTRWRRELNWQATSWTVSKSCKSVELF